MIILFKKFFLIILFLFSFGCSFSPLYSGSGDDNNNKNIKVGVIVAGKDGQKLRGFLIDAFRDILISKKNYNLEVELRKEEKTYALNEWGNATRVMFFYIAQIKFLDSLSHKVLLEKELQVYNTYNISDRGDVLLAMYGNMNVGLLKELASKIAENIKMVIDTSEKNL